MLDPNLRFQLSDDLLRRFGAALRGVQLYSPTHPIVTRNLDALVEGLKTLHAHESAVVIGLLGDELIVGDQPMTTAGPTLCSSWMAADSASTFFPMIGCPFE